MPPPTARNPSNMPALLAWSLPKGPFAFYQAAALEVRAASIAAADVRRDERRLFRKRDAAITYSALAVDHRLSAAGNVLQAGGSPNALVVRRRRTRKAARHSRSPTTGRWS